MNVFRIVLALLVFQILLMCNNAYEQTTRMQYYMASALTATSKEDASKALIEAFRMMKSLEQRLRGPAHSMEREIDLFYNLAQRLPDERLERNRMIQGASPPLGKIFLAEAFALERGMYTLYGLLLFCFALFVTRKSNSSTANKGNATCKNEPVTC